MPDLLIHTHRNITIISARSERGKKWLMDNMVLDAKDCLVVQREYLEDLISKFKEDELEYEEV